MYLHLQTNLLIKKANFSFWRGLYVHSEAALNTYELNYIPKQQHSGETQRDAAFSQWRLPTLSRRHWGSSSQADLSNELFLMTQSPHKLHLTHMVSEGNVGYALFYSDMEMQPCEHEFLLPTLIFACVLTDRPLFHHILWEKKFPKIAAIRDFSSYRQLYTRLYTKLLEENSGAGCGRGILYLGWLRTSMKQGEL